MPRWVPVETWKDLDVFIIGGGNSLRNFDWNLLKDECTIGCNSAFIHGSEICNICIFGDTKWFNKFKGELNHFDGLVFTSHREYMYSKIEWLWWLPRKPKGLSKKELGWNKNTGSNAINLALILGAKRVYLLGFDMKLLDPKCPNWHDRLIHKLDIFNAELYKRFNKGFKEVARCLPRAFPGSQIINVTDDSNLDAFPKISLKDFWKERKRNG